MSWAWYLLQPCGSEAAYRRHKRNGEDACQPCLDAAARAAEGRDAVGKKRERRARARAEGRTAA